MEKLPKNQAVAPPATATTSSFPLATGIARRKNGNSKSEPAVKGPSAGAAPKTTPEERLCNRAMAGLGKRAAGCATIEVKTTYEADADGERKVKNEVVTRKQSPPDLDAIIFALTNINGVKWRTKSADGDVQQPAGSGLAPLPDEVLRGLLPYFQKDEK